MDFGIDHSETGGSQRGFPAQTWSYPHFRVERGRPKGWPKGNEWANGDVRACGRGSGRRADLSTRSPLDVDLSPGREADLWITPVDNENLQVGLVYSVR